MPISMIVGLKNPGAAYANTRHNAGAWFVESLIEKYQLTLKADLSKKGEVATLSHPSGTCRLILPLTFMNHSGQCVQAFSSYYQIPPESILIIHDDLDLPLGKVKLKTHGGTGGHNGLKSIQTHLHTDKFNRLRIGIDHPEQKHLVHDYVLSKPSQADKAIIINAIENTLEYIDLILNGELAIAMNNINQ
jgi:PTH1 family peptidyl-tRNA hydrolase